MTTSDLPPAHTIRQAAHRKGEAAGLERAASWHDLRADRLETLARNTLRQEQAAHTLALAEVHRQSAAALRNMTDHDRDATDHPTATAFGKVARGLALGQQAGLDEETAAARFLACTIATRHGLHTTWQYNGNNLTENGQPLGDWHVTVQPVNR